MYFLRIVFGAVQMLAQAEDSHQFAPDAQRDDPFQPGRIEIAVRREELLAHFAIEPHGLAELAKCVAVSGKQGNGGVFRKSGKSRGSQRTKHQRLLSELEENGATAAGNLHDHRQNLASRLAKIAVSRQRWSKLTQSFECTLEAQGVVSHIASQSRVAPGA